MVFGSDGNALYFSRSMIPFLRRGGAECGVWLHWGIYAYRRSALENGIAIRVVTSKLQSIGVDTPEDLAAAEKRLAETKCRTN